MSTALRIASVTQCLRIILQNGLHENKVADIVAGGDVVSVLAPDKIDVSVDKEPSQLNLFLYQITYNQGWRNFDQPAFNSKGERISNPPLGINLHYFLTAYGKGDLDANILLGYGMQFFHENPVLDRAFIRTSLSRANLSDPYKELSTSFLADQIEQVKLTPDILTIEDISKLWAAFGTKYRTTAAYKVTMVLIESEKSIKPGLPVVQRNVYVNPKDEPVIEKILSQKTDNDPATEDQKILAGYRMILQGKQLNHEKVTIDIDGNPALRIPKANIKIDNNDRISFIVSNKLTPGIHELQVVHPSSIGSPPTEHVGIKSAPITFALSPSVTILPVTERTENGGLVSAKINLTVKPGANAGQKILLLLSELSNSETPLAYSFKNPPTISSSPAPASESISIKITNVKKAIYLLRLSVDGAESQVTFANGKFAELKIDLR